MISIIASPISLSWILPFFRPVFSFSASAEAMSSGLFFFQHKMKFQVIYGPFMNFYLPRFLSVFVISSAWISERGG